MKNVAKPALLLSLCLLLLSACNNSAKKQKTTEAVTTGETPKEYFSVMINGVLWQAFPSKEFKAYNLSYKEHGKQFSIFAEADNGSRIDLSFHAINGLKPGSYPSTRNDNGIQSGVFYYPEAKSSDREMASTTMDTPVQENTVQITKIDKTNKAAYIIEGTFSPVLYALYETNPERTIKLTGGKFRVIYRPDSMDPAF